jgi:hypothetical protein
MKTLFPKYCVFDSIHKSTLHTPTTNLLRCWSGAEGPQRVGLNSTVTTETQQCVHNQHLPEKKIETTITKFKNSRVAEACKTYEETAHLSVKKNSDA